MKGPLAQLVEQLTFNQLVEGSNPSRPTIYIPENNEVGGLSDIVTLSRISMFNYQRISDDL